jgi:DNA-binding SARP family transcriptional activator
MDFRVLGRACAVTDGQDIELNEQPRQVLAVFLLRPNWAYSHVELGDALYEPRVTHTDTMVRQAVLRLRESLGPKGTEPRARVETLSKAYRFRVERDELDLTQFLTLADKGHAADDRGDLAAAELALDGALKLWGDAEPLADVPDTPVNADYVNPLLARRDAVAEKLIDVRLALGHHFQLLPWLRSRVGSNQVNEHAHAQLMLALYRCHRGAESLAVYDRVRHALTEQMGLNPGPELEKLVAAILRDDPQLLSAAPGSKPLTLLPPPPWTPKFQLPLPPPDFTGRDLEFGELLSRLADAPPVTLISGPAGSGKTALAVQVGWLLRPKFRDGELYVDLNSNGQPRDARDILEFLLCTMGVAKESIPAAEEDRASMYRELLANHRVLVVADNASRISQVLPLVPGKDGGTLLVISRNTVMPGYPGHTVTLSPRPPQRPPLGRPAGANQPVPPTGAPAAADGGNGAAPDLAPAARPAADRYGAGELAAVAATGLESDRPDPPPRIDAGAA